MEPIYNKVIKPAGNWISGKYNKAKKLDKKMVLRKEMSKMIKKIIKVILALATIWFIGDANLKGKSVYYAKHSPSSNTRDLEIMMLVENIQKSADSEGFSYRVDGDKTIQNTTKNVYLLSRYSVNDANYEYVYISNERQYYYFDENFKLKEVVDVGNNRQHIDISTVDENKIKEEIYENFKPILKELEEEKPFINLQWIFNWVYRDRIK